MQIWIILLCHVYIKYYTTVVDTWSLSAKNWLLYYFIWFLSSVQSWVHEDISDFIDGWQVVGNRQATTTVAK